MLTIKAEAIKFADLFEGDLELTSPPNLFLELKKVLDDPTKSLADAGEVISNDPGLTMRLLKLVNSAYYGFPGRIATVAHAISVIGTDELQNLVLATVIIGKFLSKSGTMATMHDFWAMSLRSALMAKELVNFCKTKNNKEPIFVCGLVHDIGKLVFYRRIPEIAWEIGHLVEETGADEVAVEQDMLGFNHYDVGAELARLWNLPAIITETIAQHCQPDTTSPFCFAADLVRAANLISKMELSDHATDLTEWGISDDDLCAIIEKVDDQFNEIFSIYYPAI